MVDNSTWPSSTRQFFPGRGDRKPQQETADREVYSKAQKDIFICIFLVLFALFFIIVLRRSEGNVEKGEKKRLTRKQILKRFNNFRRVVKEEHFSENKDIEGGLEWGSAFYPVGQENEDEFVSIPKPGQIPDRLEMVERKIPNCCSICLAAYRPGETLVWSSNSSCPHAFHEDCILQWIVVRGEPICPYCRQDFLEPEAEI